MTAEMPTASPTAADDQSKALRLTRLSGASGGNGSVRVIQSQAHSDHLPNPLASASCAKLKRHGRARRDPREIARRDGLSRSDPGAADRDHVPQSEIVRGVAAVDAACRAK